MRSILARASVAASCAALLALTGCTGGSDDDGTDSDSSAREWTPGPLDEYQAKIYGYSFDDDEQSREQMQEESERQMREVEELVASCMQEEGFDYIPQDNSSFIGFTPDDLDVEWGSREFAETYGYGISTDPWGNEDRNDEAQEWTDPNQEYLDSMSEGEQQAYYEALYGVQEESEADEEDVVVEYDWTQGGCQGAAQHEVYEGGTDSEDFADLEEEMNNLWDLVQADSRMVELNASWASCMADAGYDGQTTVNESNQALYDEWYELEGWNDPEWIAVQENWDWDAEPDGPPEPERDAAAVEAFTAKEMAMAIADFECQDSLDYQGKSVEIDHALQQEFVDQHRAELDAWVEHATQARASR